MEKKTFEQAIEELETLVLKIENENLDLEDAINCYKKSKELSLYCESLISNAKQKITYLDSQEQ